MSLKGFHVLFISASVLLAIGMGAWCLPTNKAAALASFATAALLVAYESWFLRKARRLP
ncbi:MAG TPA: hypothetical protein VFB67_06400 [Candidatus Polarisedimenticolaceae bacterium]|nr:hypothetical protein [Candidatus Polarisedimenticolaceae bacterium]